MSDDLKPDLTPEEAARAKFLEDFQALMSGTADKGATFRRFLWHLIEDPGWCGSMDYVDKRHGLPELKDMYFSSGTRSVGMRLMQTAMAVGDENYKRMLNEAISLKVSREMRQLLENRRTNFSPE